MYVCIYVDIYIYIYTHYIPPSEGNEMSKSPPAARDSHSFIQTIQTIAAARSRRTEWFRRGDDTLGKPSSSSNLSVQAFRDHPLG